MNQNHQTPNIKWTEKELVLTLGYYVFVYKINKSAELITVFWSDLVNITKNMRTVGSVQMRISNFSYVDPEVKKGYAGGASKCTPLWFKYIQNGLPTNDLYNVFKHFCKSTNHYDFYEEFLEKAKIYCGAETTGHGENLNLCDDLQTLVKAISYHANNMLLSTLSGKNSIDTEKLEENFNKLLDYSKKLKETLK